MPGRAGVRATATPPRGTSWCPAATVDALAETFDDGAGKPLPARLLDCARRGGGGGRRQPRTPVRRAPRGRTGRRLCGPLGHARRSPRRRPRRPAGRAASALRPARGALREDAARSVDTGRRCAPGGARRAPRARRPRLAGFVGRGREPRGAGRRRGRDRSGRPRTTTGGDMSERYPVTSLDELAVAGDPRPGAVAHDPVDARDRRLRDQRLDGDRGRPVSSSASTTRSRTRRAARGAVPRPLPATRPSPSTARPSSAPAGTRRARARPGRQAGRDRHARAPRSSPSAPSRGRSFTALRRGSGRRRRFASGRPRSGTRRSRYSRAISPRRPSNAGMHYNLACAAGARRPSRRGARASRRVTRARSRASPSYARTDDDLASIRDDPRFPAG